MNPLTSTELLACRELLLQLTWHPDLWPTHEPAFHEIVKLAKNHNRKLEARRDTDVRDSSGLRTGEVVTALPAFARERKCYICQQSHDRPLRFYDAMCEACGDFNDAKRELSTDLTGRVALGTGGRIHSGYHVARTLLRAGADVIVAKRFPNNARVKFMQ